MSIPTRTFDFLSYQLLTANLSYLHPTDQRCWPLSTKEESLRIYHIIQ